jgi:hypothetical protein
MSAAVVTAVRAYPKINAQGQWIDRSEQVNLNELFERMTQEELEVYARDGQLPVSPISARNRFGPLTRRFPSGFAVIEGRRPDAFETKRKGRRAQNKSAAGCEHGFRPSPTFD